MDVTIFVKIAVNFAEETVPDGGSWVEDAAGGELTLASVDGWVLDSGSPVEFDAAGFVEVTGPLVVLLDGSLLFRR